MPAECMTCLHGACIQTTQNPARRHILMKNDTTSGRLFDDVNAGCLLATARWRSSLARRQGPAHISRDASEFSARAGVFIFIIEILQRDNLCIFITETVVAIRKQLIYQTF